MALLTTASVTDVKIKFEGNVLRKLTVSIFDHGKKS